MSRTLLGLIFSLSLLFAVSANADSAAPPAGQSATILIGLDWIGLWQDGHIAVKRDLQGWTLGAARLQGQAIEIAADRADAAETTGAFLRFDAKTLEPRGQGNDQTLAMIAPRTPIGLDTDFPDDSARLTAALTSQMPKVPHRIVVAPDGSVAAILTSNAKKSAAQGPVIDMTNNHALPGTHVTIDDGKRRDDGAAQAVACLLPHGEGVIYTTLGAPADRDSTFQHFPAGHAPVDLQTVVYSCLAPDR